MQNVSRTRQRLPLTGHLMLFESLPPSGSVAAHARVHVDDLMQEGKRTGSMLSRTFRLSPLTPSGGAAAVRVLGHDGNLTQEGS